MNPESRALQGFDPARSVYFDSALRIGFPAVRVRGPMSRKSQALLLEQDDFHSEQWPYAELYAPALSQPQASDLETTALLPALLPTHPLSEQDEALQSYCSFDVSPGVFKKQLIRHLLSFSLGVVCTATLLSSLAPEPSPAPMHRDALAALEELNQAFATRSAEVEIAAAATSTYAQLSGPALISALRAEGASAQRPLWIEASARKDERITLSLLSLLDTDSEHTQVRAMLALSAPFHAQHDAVFSRVVRGIAEDFSPFLRAYATKMIAQSYGTRAERFLRSRVMVEEDSFVLAVTTRMLQDLEGKRTSL